MGMCIVGRVNVVVKAKQRANTCVGMQQASEERREEPMRRAAAWPCASRQPQRHSNVKRPRRRRLALRRRLQSTMGKRATAEADDDTQNRTASASRAGHVRIQAPGAQAEQSAVQHPRATALEKTPRRRLHCAGMDNLSRVHRPVRRPPPRTNAPARTRHATATGAETSSA